MFWNNYSLCLKNKIIFFFRDNTSARGTGGERKMSSREAGNSVFPTWQTYYPNYWVRFFGEYAKQESQNNYQNCPANPSLTLFTNPGPS